MVPKKWWIITAIWVSPKTLEELRRKKTVRSISVFSQLEYLKLSIQKITEIIFGFLGEDDSDGFHTYKLWKVTIKWQQPMKFLGQVCAAYRLVNVVS